MDKHQKQVQLALLNHEEENKKKLAANYKKALKEVKKRLFDMMADPDFQGKRVARAKWDLMLEAQLETILSKLGETNVSDMTAYLDTMYREAYLGCIYGIHQNGVGLVIQINEDKVERSLNRKTNGLKFSRRLYKNVNDLKKAVKEEMARGFSTGRDYISIARQVSLRAGISLGRACTIARTEGHRVTEESRLDCMKESVKKGAATLKQWDSTLDGITRPHHRELDGQVREVDEPFEIPSTGEKAMQPGGFGIAKEDINCRCAMVPRARWALGERMYKYSRDAGGIISIPSGVYRDWKNKYNKSVEILLKNAPGKSAADTINDKIRLLEVLSSMPARAAESLMDVEYRFGEERSRYDTSNNVVYLKQGTPKKVMLHEIGHVLEKKLFDWQEVHDLKKRYTKGLSDRDIAREIYETESGQDVEIVLVKSDRFVDEYQGRLYVSRTERAVNGDGTINVDIMDEFISVLVPEYFMEPGKLGREYPELYEFIRSHLE